MNYRGFFILLLTCLSVAHLNASRRGKPRRRSIDSARRLTKGLVPKAVDAPQGLQVLVESKKDEASRQNPFNEMPAVVMPESPDGMGAPLNVTFGTVSTLPAQAEKERKAALTYASVASVEDKISDDEDTFGPYTAAEETPKAVEKVELPNLSTTGELLRKLAGDYKKASTTLREVGDRRRKYKAEYVTHQEQLDTYNQAEFNPAKRSWEAALKARNQRVEQAGIEYQAAIKAAEEARSHAVESAHHDAKAALEAFAQARDERFTVAKAAFEAERNIRGVRLKIGGTTGEDADPEIYKPTPRQARVEEDQAYRKPTDAHKEAFTEISRQLTTKRTLKTPKSARKHSAAKTFAAQAEEATAAYQNEVARLREIITEVDQDDPQVQAFARLLDEHDLTRVEEDAEFIDGEAAGGPEDEPAGLLGLGGYVFGLL